MSEEKQEANVDTRVDEEILQAAAMNNPEITYPGHQMCQKHMCSQHMCPQQMQPQFIPYTSSGYIPQNAPQYMPQAPQYYEPQAPQYMPQAPQYYGSQESQYMHEAAPSQYYMPQEPQNMPYMAPQHIAQQPMCCPFLANYQCPLVQGQGMPDYNAPIMNPYMSGQPMGMQYGYGF